MGNQQQQRAVLHLVLGFYCGDILLRRSHLCEWMMLSEVDFGGVDFYSGQSAQF